MVSERSGSRGKISYRSQQPPMKALPKKAFMNANSEKILLKRFNQEFTKVFEEITFHNRIPAAICRSMFEEVLQKMGYIDTNILKE